MPTTSRSRIHPLMAAAAVSTTLVSVMGIAALSGVLPWIPVSAPQKPLAGSSGLRGTGGATASVLPIASLKSALPLTAADSLAPGESLIGNDKLSASRTGTSTTALAVQTIQSSPGIQAAAAMPRSAPAQMTLATSISPAVSPATAVAAPVAISRAPQSAVVVAAPRTFDAARQAQSVATSDAVNRSLPERQRARDMAMVTSSGNSNNGTNATGAAPRSAGRSTNYRTTNDQRLYSDARGTPNGPPKITPIYRADGSSDPVPPVIYQDQLQPSQAQRPANRATGDLAVVSDRSKGDQNRRFGNIEGSSSPYTVAPAANGTERDNPNATTAGTAIGRVVSKGIDKTISVISDVLNGRYVAPPPSEPQDSIYR